MKKMPLTQDMFALVDDDMYEFLSRWKWYAYKSGNIHYAARSIKGNTVKMHRVIMATPSGKEIDHINHNGLDNRKANLRECTHAENCYNQKPAQDTTSKYRGVHKVREKWRAEICHNNKRIHIGYYDSEQDAAAAYNRKAEELFGHFACLNTTERSLV